MLANLRRYGRPPERMIPEVAPATGDDTHSMILRKLLEGYQLEPEPVCDMCMMPLMLYRGRMLCVVCHWGEDGASCAEHGRGTGPSRQTRTGSTTRS